MPSKHFLLFLSLYVILLVQMIIHIVKILRIFPHNFLLWSLKISSWFPVSSHCITFLAILFFLFSRFNWLDWLIDCVAFWDFAGRPLFFCSLFVFTRLIKATFFSKLNFFEANKESPIFFIIIFGISSFSLFKLCFWFCSECGQPLELNIFGSN